MGELVYILCALTSTGCTVLLLGRYRRSRSDLLFWSAVGFSCLTATNILLFVDLALLPRAIDLSLIRNSITLVGTIVMLYGLIHNNTK